MPRLQSRSSLAAGLGRSICWSVLGLVLSFASSSRAEGEVVDCSYPGFLAALQGGGLVRFACDGTISITNTVVLSADTIFDASGHTVTLDGLSQTRLFLVQPGVRVAFTNINLVRGRFTGQAGSDGASGESVAGAGIHNDGGDVTLEDCTLFGHELAGGAGGPGRTGNFDGQNGGNGGAGGYAFGAAIYNNGTLALARCTLSGNSASGGDGGLGGNARPGSSGSGGNGGDAGSGRGGGIYNTANGVATISDSFFSTNSVRGALAGQAGAGASVLGGHGRNGISASGAGGALLNAGGIVTVSRSTFGGNSAFGANGPAGLASDGLNGGDGYDGTRGSDGAGGALANEGSLSITNSTFFANIAAGGDGGNGGPGISDGFGGDGGNGGNGGDGRGGALSNLAAADVVNSTFSQNIARGGAGGTNGLGGGFVGRAGNPGNAGASAGGAVDARAGQTRIKNSLFAAGLNGGNLSGPIADEGYNLSSDASAFLPGPGSRSGVNPLLDALGSHGGFAPTLPLLTNSPAIDAIADPGRNGGPAIDQRGATRSALSDIGAFEFNPVGPALSLLLQTNNVAILWPQYPLPLTLESTSSLVATSQWTAVTSPLTTNGNTVQAAVPSTNGQAFFRLRGGP